VPAPEAAPGDAISLALKVPRAKGEETRRRLREQGLLRQDLKPLAEGPWLLVPVREAARAAFLGFEFTTAAFQPQQAPPPRYQELAEVPEHLRDLLPTSFDVVGEVVVVKLPPELEPHGAAVGAALLQAHKGARTVLLDRGVHGRDRVRQVEILAGAPDTVAEHIEHGVRLRVDLAKAYFSPRLASERLRTAEQVQQGEVVLDLFAGAGPFAILIAKRGRASKVYAVDINPDAVRWMEENVRRNKVEAKVRAVLGDADAFAATLRGQCDRVIMNLPHSADQHWEAALGACKPHATLHYHRILPRDAVDAHAAELVARARAAGRAAQVVATREVRLYSPTQSHVAFDVAVRPLGPASGPGP
jgi:tRNA (guanine37-N1)-methyltransferase